MSWRSASTWTSRPASRAVSLVIGPIETIAGCGGEVVAERFDQVADGRGGGEGDVVGGLGGLDRLGVGILAHRLVEGDDVDLGAALAQGVGEDVARLGGAGDEDAAPLDLDSRQRLDQRLGDEALGDDVGGDAVLGEGAGRARPDGGDRSCPPGAGEFAAAPAPAASSTCSFSACRRVTQRPSVKAGRGQCLEQQVRAVRAGDADERVLADRGDRAPHLVALDSRLDPDRRQLDHLGAERRAGCAARPLAWARARVTTTRRPCRGRRSSQASASRRWTTGPTTISAGAPMPSRSTAAAIVPSVAVTVRCPAIVPRSTAAAGSSGSRPASISAAAFSASRLTPM